MSRLKARLKIEYESFNLDASLDVPAENVTVVYGPSGCGKTTLLRCLAGLERSPSGFVQVGEEIWQDESRGIFLPVHKRSLGIVFQEARLFPHMTVRSNLGYGLKRTPPYKRRISMDQVVDILDIGHILDRSLKGLSGGEQQRIAIGRALLTSPSLLLMDEPLANLDSRRKREILPFFLRLRKELRLPIIYVSHSMNEILQLVDTLILLENGKVLASGPANEVLSRPDFEGHIGQPALGTMLEPVVAGHDEDFGLTRLDYKGQSLFIPRQPVATGQTLRLYILAKDVSIVVGPKDIRTSVLNILEGTVLEISEGRPEDYSVNIRLDIGDPVMATITKKSLSRLDLKLGQKVYAHIKAVKMTPKLEEF